MKNIALKSAGAASLLTAAALIVSGGNSGNKNNPDLQNVSANVAQRVLRATTHNRAKPFLTAKDTPKILSYVQEMHQQLTGMSDEVLRDYFNKLDSLRLSKEDIEENWDTLMQPISIDGKEQRLLIYLSNINDHIRSTVSSADFIHENWEQLLTLSKDLPVSEKGQSESQETLFDYVSMFYNPTFGDSVLQNHLGDLMKWHFDKVKTGQYNQRDPLGWWLQKSDKNGFLSFNDIAPYIPLIDAELDNEWHDQHHSSVITLLDNNNLILHDDAATRFRLRQGTLRQPNADSPLVYNGQN